MRPTVPQGSRNLDPAALTASAGGLVPTPRGGGEEPALGPGCEGRASLTTHTVWAARVGPTHPTAVDGSARRTPTGAAGSCPWWQATPSLLELLD